MFYLTRQERKFICVMIVIFILGALVQLAFKRDIAPMRWAQHVRAFKININTARADQLQMLPGIGATLAHRIIDYRQEIQDYKSLEDLQEVDGMTKKRFLKIKDLIEL